VFPKPTYNCFSALSLIAFAFFSVSLCAPFSAQTNAATLTVESASGSDGIDDGPTRILFVFDASNSMNAFWSGERKIVLATRLLSKSLASLYGTTDLELGLRAYGHGTKHIEGQQDCDDTELIVPIKKGTNLIIKQELGRLKAQGTTPIARSLEKSAEDFPSEPGKNIIILITDGIEACDEDPCAVSRMLQSKGIVVKPFIIGIGIDDKHKESLRCVGNFYDATNPEVFETVLDLVLEQALHNTTVEVRLLDEEGDPTVTDVPMTFTDLRSGTHHPQVVHTLSFNNLTDTFYLDPIPTYSLKLHTLPNRGMDSVQLSPGRHNIISVPNMEQGLLSPQFPNSKRNAYNNLGVDIYESGECNSFYSIEIGESATVLTGTYDLVFHTSPLTYVYGVTVEEDVPTNITIAAPGSLMLQSNTSGFGSIVDASTLEHIIQLPSGNPSGRYTLQPGTYTIIFRARRARSSKYSFQSKFTITSGTTLNLNLHD